MATQVNDAAWMRWVTGLLGGRSRQMCAATLPPDRFYCLLDELPLHLLPGGASNMVLGDPKKPLFPNPECQILPAGHLPEELISQPELVSNFALQGTIAWVRNFAGILPLPFWLGSSLQAKIRSLRPRQDARNMLSASECRMLASAGVLCPGGEVFIPPRNSSELVQELRKDFRENNYAVFSRLLHPFQVSALRRYYRCLIRKGAFRLGDAQSPRRYTAYNEPVARFFHHYLTRIVSEVAGEPVKPSYTYMASYLSGAELKKHTDREQCEFSISFCLDFSPEPQGATSWPLCLHTSQGPIGVHQALGDGLFYRGTRVPHYREALREGCTSTSIFFHYVSTSFAGSLA